MPPGRHRRPPFRFEYPLPAGGRCPAKPSVMGSFGRRFSKRCLFIFLRHPSRGFLSPLIHGKRWEQMKHPQRPSVIRRTGTEQPRRGGPALIRGAVCRRSADKSIFYKKFSPFDELKISTIQAEGIRPRDAQDGWRHSRGSQRPCPPLSSCRGLSPSAAARRLLPAASARSSFVTA